MVVLIIENWFPHGKSMDLAKKIFEVVKEFPEDKTLGEHILNCIRADKEGLHGINAWDIKKGKLEEAIIRFGTEFLRYGDIEGYRYEIKTYVTGIEAFSMIGMKPPE